jgi:tripartite-type tricarboxylate transporter receptor subunit TctC
MPQRRTLLAAGLAGLAAPAFAQARWSPSRAVTIVVPFPPGGATDVIARLMAVPMSEALGQPVVVENRTGGGGTTGTASVARAAPDGHTMLMGTIATHGIIPGLFAQLPYDPLADFAPVTQAASQPYVLVVHPNVAARNVAELIALIRARPGQLSYASAGNGTAGHLAAELFRDSAGRLDALHVPYRGAGPAVADMLAGRVDFTFDVLLTMADHIREGRLRALAVTGSARSPAMPEVPTLAETLPGYEAVGWNGLFLPARTPAPVAARLADESRAALRRPEVRDQVARQGADAVGNAPEEFGRFVQAELARWRGVIQRTGVRAE